MSRSTRPVATSVNKSKGNTHIMANANESVFNISIVGETTKEKWLGKFRAKTVLSHRDYIKKDQERRRLLGSMGGEPDDRCRNISLIVSELSVRLVEVPKWWVETDGGLDLLDDNVLANVFNEAMRVEKEAYEEKQKQAEAAKEELKVELKADMPNVPETK